MEPAGRQEQGRRYSAFLQELAQSELCAADASPLPLPPEAELESLWADGLLPGLGCQTLGHGPALVLDCGSWNRSSGPDFLRAEVEIGGVRVRGDIELSHSVAEWEVCGCADDPAYRDVILHVVFTPPPAGWYTRGAGHREIPVLYLEEERWMEACGRSHPLAGQEPGPAPLEHMPLGALVSLMQGAAARRVEYKRQLFRARVNVVGESQAWYEALAATLGYSANKQTMGILARRAPLSELGEYAEHAEAVLFGTAGFLVPLLPERADEEARIYHRHVWDAWWPLRGQYGLAERRRIPWHLAAGRPLNHPHRRVAALAIAARRWREIEPHLHSGGAQELARVLGSLSHPYWDWHCSLPSAALARPAALIGKARIRDFLVNHVYVQDDSAGSWQAYLCLGAAELPQHIRRVATQLLGARTDVEPLLKLSFAQQALLQLERDCCCDGAYPAALASWPG